MALVVEDGSGKANANAFVTVEAVGDYATAIGNSSWGAAAQAEQEAAIVRATLYLRNEQRYPYRGTKRSYAQRLPWPRTGAVEHRGLPVPEDAIPPAIADACCELAIRELDSPGSLQPDAARGGAVVSESVGPISTTYAADAPTETVIRTVAGLLAPLLRCDGDTLPVPFVGGTETPLGVSVGFMDYAPLPPGGGEL